MGLKIFDTDAAKASDRQDFSEDLVGRFRSGYVVDGKPQSLEAFRVTTGDPEVAAAIQESLGGDDPQEWESKGEDNLEVFTSASSVDIVIESAKDIVQKMVLRNMNGEVVRSGDGEVLEDGRPDPQAGQSFQERKQAARDGMGAKPETDVFFKIEGQEDLGKFKFHTGSWDFVSDLNYYDTVEEIENYGGPVRATLSLTEVSFTAKSGPRKGRKVTYTKPVLKVKGAA